MEVSIPIDKETIEVIDHNVIDETKAYDKGVAGVQYITHDVWQDTDKLYEFVGDSFIPVDFWLPDASGYVVGQIVFKDGSTQKVTSIGSYLVAQQPEAYPITTTTNYDNFTERYNKLKTGLTLPFEGYYDMVIGDSKHSLYRTAITEAFPYGWVYRVSWISNYNVWSATQYSTTYRIVYTLTTATGAKNITITWNGVVIYNSATTFAPDIPIGIVFTGTDGKRYKNIAMIWHDVATTGPDIPIYDWGAEVYSFQTPKYHVIWASGFPTQFYWNNINVANYSGTPYVGLIVTGTDGHRYKVGLYKGEASANYYYGIYRETITYIEGETEPYDIYYYSVSQEQPVSETVYKWQSARVTYESALDVYEEAAYSFDTPTSERWVGRHFIIRGTDLYVRTQVALPIIELAVSDNQYQVIEALSEFPNFIENGLVNAMKPLDNTNYTYFTQQGTPNAVYYKLKSTSDKFDTIALSNLIADDIQVIFRDAQDVEVARIDSYEPKNYRDITIDDSGIETHRLPPYPTTVILYSTADNIIPEGGYVELYLSGNNIKLGTIKLGLSVSAGFTNLTFTNKFNDWSPKEVDQWGNVSYITGVKANVFSGTVDVRVEDYDMTTRLMTSIGGSTVILNGSDAKDNQTPDNVGIFASTMLIGRLKDFQLKTKIADDDMDIMATYTFTLEENI